MIQLEKGSINESILTMTCEGNIAGMEAGDEQQLAEVLVTGLMVSDQGVELEIRKD
jgi:hypothetical protein